jgi:hypothetical protein
MRWAGHVAGMGEKRNKCMSLVWKLKERDHFEDLVLDGRSVLKYVLKKSLIWLRTGTSGRLL